MIIHSEDQLYLAANFSIRHQLQFLFYLSTDVEDLFGFEVSYACAGNVTCSLPVWHLVGIFFLLKCRILAEIVTKCCFEVINQQSNQITLLFL